jgi:diguanylate cyclase (GGDEF)-like protein
VVYKEIFNTYEARVAVVITVVLVLLILLFARLSLGGTSNIIIKIIANGLQDKSVLVAHDINGFIRERVVDARVLSQAAVLESGDMLSTTRYLEEVVAVNKWVNDIDVLDNDGDIRATAWGEDNEIGSNIQSSYPGLISPAEFLPDAEHGDVFISEVRTLETHRGLLLMTPITDDTNTSVIGAVVLEISLNNISRVADLLVAGASASASAGEHTYIVDSSGKVITSTNAEIEVSSVFPALSEPQRFFADFSRREKTGNAIYSNRDGDELIIGYASTDKVGVNTTLGWTVVATAPLNEATEAIADVKFSLSVLVVVIGVVAMLLVVFYLSELRRILREVIKVASSISSGDYSKRLILPGKSTVLYVLAVAFNDMVETVGRSIRELVQREDTILYQAHYDHLTGVPNRLLILDRLSQLISEAARDQNLVGVLFLDIDNFKKVNDTLGHYHGDEVLVEICSRLNNAVREGDSVGRLGGDEFVVLLRDMENALDAKVIADNILCGVRESFKIDGRELHLTVSIGISIYPDNGTDSSQLLHHADSAMYHSKSLGRNTASYFTEELNSRMTRLIAVEEQMRGALERKEFEVYYQPKVAIDSGEIAGAEALLRWNNSVLGSIFPDEFIPVAEQTGLIIPIGKFVFNEAFEATKEWMSDFDEDFSIAVNLSPRQFNDAELVSSIRESIERVRISPSCVEVEITEGILMGDHPHISDALAELDALGIKIALDDFGTGYSSLSYLRKYPFDILKIDQSFISGIAVDSADKKLTDAAIAMAHSLDLDVVAEGIETIEQLSFLKEMECEFGQGYLFSKPVPKDQMTEILSIASGGPRVS